MPTPSARIRVKLKDIKQNPFRSFDIYAIDRERVKRLKASIKETDWWDNVEARKKDGEVELAYGHHRVEAMKEIFGPEHEIEIPVKDLSDDQMIRRMSRENDPVFDCSPAAIDDATRAAREYLKSHPRIAREVLTSAAPEVKRVRVGAPMIAKFLGRKEGTVENSLERLNLIESKQLIKEAIYVFPSVNRMDNFISAVKHCRIQPKDQLGVARKIVKEGLVETVKMELAYAGYAGRKMPGERFNRPEIGSALGDEMRKISGKVGSISWGIINLRDTINNRGKEGRLMDNLPPQEVFDKFVESIGFMANYIKEIEQIIESSPGWAKMLKEFKEHGKESRWAAYHDRQKPSLRYKIIFGSNLVERSGRNIEFTAAGATTMVVEFKEKKEGTDCYNWMNWKRLFSCHIKDNKEGEIAHVVNSQVKNCRKGFRVDVSRKAIKVWNEKTGDVWLEFATTEEYKTYKLNGIFYLAGHKIVATDKYLDVDGDKKSRYQFPNFPQAIGLGI